jgi:hypothetical protein
MEQARRDYYLKFIEVLISEDSFKRLVHYWRSHLESATSPYKDFSGLANDFGKFFVQKIDNIRSKLDNFELDSPSMPEGEPGYTGSLFTEFRRTSSEKIKEIVLSFPNKSCASDPIPIDMVKDCTDGFVASYL